MIFTLLNTEITNLTKTFTTEIMQNIITNITPVVIAGLTIWIIVYGILIINQTIEQSLQSFVKECFKIGVITSIALAGGIYQTTILDIVINLPDDLAKSVFKNPSDSFATADHMLVIGLNKGWEIIKSAEIWHPLDGGVKIIIGIFIAIATSILGAIGGGLLLLVKVQITIFGAFGPLAIISLLFPRIRSLFNNWLSEIIAYALFSLMLTVIFVFILQISEQFINQIVDGDNMFTATFVYMILVGLGGLLFFEAKKSSARLAGVMNIGIVGGISDIAKQAVGSASANMAQGVSNSVTSTVGQTTGKIKNWRKR